MDVGQKTITPSRPEGASMVQVCPFSKVLIFLARQAAHRNHDSPVQACCAVGRRLQAGKAQITSIENGLIHS